MIEQQVRAVGRALDQLAADLHQGGDDEPRRAAQGGELLARQRDGRQHQRDGSFASLQPHFGGALLRAAGERIALICRHLRQPAVCLGRRGVPVGEVHPQVHGDLNL